MPEAVFTIRRFAAVAFGAALSVLSLAAYAEGEGSRRAVATAEPSAGTPQWMGSGPLPAAIAGEYALQAGKLDDAARWYLDAARVADGDAVLAERATRIALLARNQDFAGQALALWRERAGRTLGMRNAEATLALQRKDEATARRELRSLLLGRGEGLKSEKDGWRYALLAMDAGSGDPDMIGRLLAALVDDIPKDLPAWLAFGEFAQQVQRQDVAAKIIGRVLQYYPNEPGVSLLHANQLRRSGKEAQARKILDRMSAAAILLPDVAYGLAREFGALGDFTAAAAVLARGPQNDNTYILRASYLAQADDKTGVAAVYEELKRESASPNPARRLLLGQVAEFIGRQDDALDWYASVPGGPQRWQARLRTAPVLHKLGRAEEAHARIREIQTDATAADETRRDAYLLQADLYKNEGRLADELATFDRGLAAYPDEPQLLYARALMWERRDDIARAEADLRRILALDADDVNALNALGYTLADRTNRYQEALELIARAYAADPDNAAIIDSYGWVLYRLGRSKEALSELLRAFTKQKDAEIAAHVAEVLWVLGRKDEAVNYFVEARRIDPDSRSLKRALDKTGAILPPLADKAGA
ncbi:MAG: tetratricopeptide repeat protein [Xanthomonadaceae bacterium]|nr:tetratricopeptide repeat protein [Xanthomonadaceae bacterium]